MYFPFSDVSAQNLSSANATNIYCVHFTAVRMGLVVEGYADFCIDGEILNLRFIHDVVPRQKALIESIYPIGTDLYEHFILPTQDELADLFQRLAVHIFPVEPGAPVALTETPEDLAQKFPGEPILAWQSLKVIFFAGRCRLESMDMTIDTDIDGREMLNMTNDDLGKSSTCISEHGAIQQAVRHLLDRLEYEATPLSLIRYNRYYTPSSQAAADALAEL
jgi:hypothetical protein